MHLSAQQAESFVDTAYAVVDAISGRAQPQQQPT
jgi:hypothetical protein